MSHKHNFFTGDLVHMKIGGEVLEATLGVVTGSTGDNGYKVLWLDEAGGAARGTYNFSALYRVNDLEGHNEVYTDW